MTQELRRLAEAANTTYEERAAMPESKFKVAYGALKTFEATANPAAILSLLDRLEKAEKDNGDLQQKVCDLRHKLETIKTHIQGDCV